MSPFIFCWGFGLGLGLGLGLISCPVSSHLSWALACGLVLSVLMCFCLSHLYASFDLRGQVARSLSLSSLALRLLAFALCKTKGGSCLALSL